MPYKPWNVVGADIFSIKKICYYVFYITTASPVVKKTCGLSADDLIRAVKIVFAEFGLAKKVVLDADMNLTSNKC